MQKQQAGVGGDDNPKPVGDRLTAAALKNFFCQKNLDVCAQRLKVPVRQATIKAEPLSQKFFPTGGERLPAQAAPLPVADQAHLTAPPV